MRILKKNIVKLSKPANFTQKEKVYKQIKKKKNYRLKQLISFMYKCSFKLNFRSFNLNKQKLWGFKEISTCLEMATILDRGQDFPTYF